MKSHQRHLLFADILIVFLASYILLSLYSQLLVPWMVSRSIDMHTSLLDIPDIVIASLGALGTFIFWKHKNIVGGIYSLVGFSLVLVYMSVVIFVNRSSVIVPDNHMQWLFLVGIPIAFISWTMVAIGYFKLVSSKEYFKK